MAGQEPRAAGGYDYIIVGAGSAGCVLANRLSADPAACVLLLEAGGRDTDPLIHIPIGVGKIYQYRLHDWGFDSEPNPGLDGRKLVLLRGKVLGGSSAINVMAYTRGVPGDYNRWARNGCPGWAFADVLPYFKMTETWEGGASERRGGDGPIGTQWARSVDPVYQAWLDSAREAGWPITEDYNGPEPIGFGRSQYTIRNGKRSSSAVAYLHPVIKRPNLTVVTHAHATRVLTSGTRATGVEYVQHGQIKRAMAGREVIVSGGAYSTPQLLMLSGIGPAAHLREMGIDVVADLPVGKNLQDHLAPLIQWSRPKNTSKFRDDLRFDRIAVNMIRAHLLGTGPGTVVPGGLHAFINSEPGLEAPDIEFMFRGAPPSADMWMPGIRPAYPDAYGIRPCILHPESRGEVLLRSSDPFASPRIFTNFLSAPGDIGVIRNAFKIGRDVGSRAPLAPYRGGEIAPGPACKTDAEIDAWIRRTTTTVEHPAGTAKMGTGADCVVDPELKVRGIERLRVVDASVMPDLVSAHLNACVLMMGEKAADMISGVSRVSATAAKAVPAPAG